MKQSSLVYAFLPSWYISCGRFKLLSMIWIVGLSLGSASFKAALTPQRTQFFELNLPLNWELRQGRWLNWLALTAWELPAPLAFWLWLPGLSWIGAFLNAGLLNYQCDLKLPQSWAKSGGSSAYWTERHEKGIRILFSQVTCVLACHLSGSYPRPPGQPCWPRLFVTATK